MKRIIQKWLGIDFLSKDLNYRWEIIRESGLLKGHQNLAIQRLEKRVNKLEEEILKNGGNQNLNIVL